MDRAALHVELRSSLEVSDELRRHEHAAGDDDLADDFAYLEDMLDELERHIGKSHTDPALCHERAARELLSAIQAIEQRRSHVPPRLRGRLRVLLASTKRVAIALSEPNAPVSSKPWFGVLPLVHLTWGAAMIASPFVFGYARKDRAASAIQVVAGACAIALAILTNSRTRLGMVTPHRSKGGSKSASGHRVGNYSVRKRRVSEMPRPLEGLSSAPTAWDPSRRT